MPESIQKSAQVRQKLDTHGSLAYPEQRAQRLLADLHADRSRRQPWLIHRDQLKEQNRLKKMKGKIYWTLELTMPEWLKFESSFFQSEHGAGGIMKKLFRN